MTFTFGRNWRKFLDELDDDRIAAAQQSLAVSFGSRSLEGERFIDVGCGSGLFSLAALAAGAAEVVSFDVDPDSVGCAEALRASSRHADRWTVLEGSVLDDSFIAALEPAGRVYSWGVLHHTGSMWSAIANATSLLDGRGTACVALYNRPRWHQMMPKQVYPHLPGPARPVFRAAYGSAVLLRSGAPRRTLREYGATSRGMSFWRDVEDWLGGWPFEWTDAEAMERFCESTDLVLERVLPGGAGGNAEYLLSRSSAAA